MKISLTPAGIETTTFRFVAQHLNHCAAAVPYPLITGQYLVGTLGVLTNLISLGILWKCLEDTFHFYTVQELRYKSKIANYLHRYLLYLDIQF